MSRYFIYQSNSDIVGSADCTTRMPSSVGCSIRASGQYLDKATNIMVLTGDDDDIDSWCAENVGKVTEGTLEEVETIGRAMNPEDVTKEVVCEYGCTHTIRSGVYTVARGQVWAVV